MTLASGMSSSVYSLAARQSSQTIRKIVAQQVAAMERTVVSAIGVGSGGRLLRRELYPTSNGCPPLQWTFLARYAPELVQQRERRRPSGTSSPSSPRVRGARAYEARASVKVPKSGDAPNPDNALSPHRKSYFRHNARIGLRCV